MKSFVLFILSLLLALPLSAQPPRIFFSDLESGPNIGGQSNHGVWVTIWGKGFGAERGKSSVTIGGGAAGGYPIWTDTKITFQLGPAAKTGEIVVRSSAASNG
ncbi:MAG TPA: IPT/TIG domain-containing protein, partial [Verrucomicrobiae bacterium]|nr:IPT/TIG domain-containing protein [Verrucomicrobiae bacterium]